MGADVSGSPVAANGRRGPGVDPLPAEFPDFPAFHIKIYFQLIARLLLAGINFIAPDGNADFFRIRRTFCFHNDILFFPLPVFTGAGLEGKQLDEFSR